MKKKLTVVLLLWMLIFLPLFGGGAINALTADAQETHTVQFVLDEGNPDDVYTSVTVESGRYLDYADLPATPAPLKNGGYFLFWTTDADSEEAFSFAEPITGDVTLFAKWASVGHTVQFTVNGSLFNEQLVTDGAAVNALGAPTITGYDFAFWTLDGETEFDFTTPITQDTLLQAKFTPKTYTVTVYAPDGSSSTIENVPHGSSVDLTQIQAPQLTGYEEWDGSSIEGNAQNVQSDTALYLIYQPQTFTVTYEAPEADGWQVEEKTVVYGQTATYSAKIPTKAEYMFVGWYVEDMAYDFSTKVMDDLTLTAKFLQIAKKYTVQFLHHDGNIYSEQLVEENHSAIRPGDPYREGYEFLGWIEDYTSVQGDIQIHPLYQIKTYTVRVYFDEELLVDTTVNYGGSIVQPDIQQATPPEGKEFLYFNGSFTDIRKDTEIHAVFRNKKYTVNFYYDNKEVGLEQTIEHGKTAVAPSAPVRAGWKFLGWAKAGSESIDVAAGATYTSAIEGNTVYFAKYEQLAYTVTFYHYNGTDAVEQKFVYGSIPSYAVEDRDGYIFLGWFTDENCTTRYNYTPVTGNLNLYAGWMVKPPTYYTVTFTVDGDAYGSFAVVEGEKVGMPVPPTKEGYTFQYWTLDGQRFDFESSITANITLEAYFTETTYTVTFKGFNSEVLGTVTVVEGQGVAEEDIPAFPEITGYTATGWDKEFTNVTENMLVHAVYTRNYYTVTFMVDNTPVDTQRVEHDGYLQIVNAEKDGQKFLGWFTEGGEKLSYGTPITGNMELYARFETEKYTIYYYYITADGEQARKQVSVEYGATIEWLLAPDDIEEGIFDGWSVNGYEAPPTEMPNKDLTATAIVKKSYTITYIVGDWSTTTSPIVEGASIGLPEGLEEIGYEFPTDIYVQFLGWDSTLPETMPTHDLIVTANILIKYYYTITYRIDGVPYGEPDRVLEGELITLRAAPEQSEDYVFNGWKCAYSKMPADDIYVDADITRYYWLSYELNGEPYGEAQKYLAGTVIVAQLPTLQPWESFNGWENVPDKMPENNVVIIGTTTLKKNYLSVEATDLGGGNVQLSIYISGDVCMAGVVGRVYFVSEFVTAESGYFTEDGLGFIYLKEQKQANFVWSSPDNVTERTLLVSVTGQFQGNIDDLVVKVELEEMVAITDEGDESEVIPTDEYVIGK